MDSQRDVQTPSRLKLNTRSRPNFTTIPIRRSRVARRRRQGKRRVEMRRLDAYAHAMSFAEILEEIPNLSFAQRQELVRRAISLDESDLTPQENALLDGRMEDFQRNPEAGIPLDQLQDL
jgi:hypothetical protein